MNGIVWSFLKYKLDQVKTNQSIPEWTRANENKWEQTRANEIYIQEQERIFIVHKWEEMKLLYPYFQDLMRNGQEWMGKYRSWLIQPILICHLWMGGNGNL